MTITRIDVVWIPITKILKEATIAVPIMSKYLSKNIIGIVILWIRKRTTASLGLWNEAKPKIAIPSSIIEITVIRKAPTYRSSLEIFENTMMLKIAPVVYIRLKAVALKKVPKKEEFMYIIKA